MILIKKIELPIPGLEALDAEAKRDGYDFIDTLVDEWASGANRFEAPGEVLCGHLVHGQLVAVGGTHQRSLHHPTTHRPHPPSLCPLRMAQPGSRPSPRLHPGRGGPKELRRGTPPRRKRRRSAALRKHRIHAHRRPGRNPHPLLRRSHLIESRTKPCAKACT
jgi:hypothetical protein